MFDKDSIPSENPQLMQYLQNILSHCGISSEQKLAIEKRMDKIDNALRDKIVNTATVSDYFNQLWQQADLKEKHKEFVIKKLESIQQATKNQIEEGEQHIAKMSGNLDIINSGFQMTPFEIHNYEEKLKNIKKKRQLDIEADLFKQRSKDVEILNAVNRPTRLSANNESVFLHYTAGLCPAGEPEGIKHVKAEEFVKKVQEDRKAFIRRMQRIEKNIEQKERDEMERLYKKEQEDEQRRQHEKKRRLEGHIHELKARSEVRIKERTQWEEDYKVYQNKKPLHEEIEERYNKAFTLPEIEDRKKKLQDIRNFYKPLQMEEILSHERKVKRMMDNRKSEPRENLLEASSWSYQKPSFESKHRKAYVEQLSRAKRTKEDDQMELLKRKEKVMELLTDVKDNHLPQKDPQLEMERLAIIDKLKKRKDGRLKLVSSDDDTKEDVDPKKLGAEYLRSVKELVQRIKQEHAKIGTSKDETMITKKIDSEVGSERTKYTTKLTLHSTKSEAHALKRPNYLAELRKENKIQRVEDQVDAIISNKKIDSKEKKVLLMNEVDKLEEKAKRKEMVRKYKSRRSAEPADLDEEDEMDLIYINSIKAKLEMLGS